MPYPHGLPSASSRVERTSRLHGVSLNRIQSLNSSIAPPVYNLTEHPGWYNQRLSLSQIRLSTTKQAAQWCPRQHHYYEPYHADPVMAHPRTAQDEYRLDSTSLDFIAGSVSGIASVAVGHPFDTLKIRLQMPTSAFTSALDCVQQTMAKEGWTGLYRGMASPMSTVPVINAVVFSAYGLAKDMMLRRNAEPQENLTTRQAMAAGAFTGMCNTVIVTPVELIKCRLQAQGRALARLTSVVSNPSSSSVIQYRGTIDCIRHILHLEGT